jgi:hypothetical protein
LLPKLIAPGRALVLIVTVPVKRTGGVDENELADTLLPRITSEALVKLMGPSLVTPPTTPPKVMVPVPAVRVSVSTPAVVALTVLLKRMLPPPAELLSVGVPVNVTGLPKSISPFVVVILAPRETSPPPLCKNEPPIVAVAAAGNAKAPVLVILKGPAFDVVIGALKLNVVPLRIMPVLPLVVRVAKLLAPLLLISSMERAVIRLDPVTPLALMIVIGPSRVMPPTAPVKVNEPPVSLNVAPSTPGVVALRVDPNVIEAVLMKVGVDVNNVTGLVKFCAKVVL